MRGVPFCIGDLMTRMLMTSLIVGLASQFVAGTTMTQTPMGTPTTGQTPPVTIRPTPTPTAPQARQS